MPDTIDAPPLSVCAYVFEQALRLGLAHHHLCLLRNTQAQLHQDKDEGTIRQRQAVIALAAKLTEQDYISALDKAAEEWLRARGIVK